jgi:RNA polymerase sigma factor (sigma-70 family)
VEKGLAELLRELHRRLQDQAPPARDRHELVVQLDLDGVRYTISRTAQEDPAIERLSPREQEIARLVAKGLPNKTIGAILEISPWTVSTHLRRMFGKLDVRCRAELVAKVLRDGWFDGDG